MPVILFRCDTSSKMKMICCVFFVLLTVQTVGSQEVPMRPPETETSPTESPSNASQTAVSSSVESTSQSQGESQNAAATDEGKALRPQLKETLSHVRHFALALSGLVTNLKQTLTRLVNDSKDPRLSDPRVQAEMARYSDQCYTLFQEQLRDILKVVEDGQLPRNVRLTWEAIAAHPDGPVKTVLLDAVEKCRKAQLTLENYRSAEKTDLNDKLTQMASAMRELDEQLQDLQAEVNLLESTGDAHEKR